MIQLKIKVDSQEFGHFKPFQKSKWVKMILRRHFQIFEDPQNLSSTRYRVIKRTNINKGGYDWTINPLGKL